MALEEVEVHGCCHLSQTELPLLARHSPRELAAASGDFVAVVRRSDSTQLISSGSGLFNYYFSPEPLPGGDFAHGTDVAGVLARGGGDGGWNHAAVADYLALGHPLGAATAAAGVERVPPGAVVTLPRGGGAPRVESPSLPRDEPQGSPDAAGETLCRILTGTDSDAALSLSGGLDSRLLLAALIACDRRPRLLVSGIEGSFDRVVAESIARRFKLPISVHEVTTRDVIAIAEETALASNGLLPTTNAAGVAHLRALGDRVDGGPVLLGYLGENARSNFAGRSLPTALRALVHGRGDASRLIRAHAQTGLSKAELEQVSPGLASALAPSAALRRLEGVLRSLPGRSSLDLSDEFFVNQHGPQKVGAELAAARCFVDPRAPFGDPAWIDTVRSLPRRWKLGDRLHRYLLGQLCPRLLEFPDELHGARTRRFPPLLTLVRTPRPRRHFYLPQAIYRNGPLQHAAAECGPELTGLVAPTLMRRIGDEQAASGERPHALFALAALARWNQAVGSSWPNGIEAPTQ